MKLLITILFISIIGVCETKCYMDFNYLDMDRNFFLFVEVRNISGEETAEMVVCEFVGSRCHFPGYSATVEKFDTKGLSEIQCPVQLSMYSRKK